MFPVIKVNVNTGYIPVVRVESLEVVDDNRSVTGSYYLKIQGARYEGLFSYARTVFPVFAETINL